MQLLRHYSIELPSLQKQRAAPNLRFVSMSLASYHHPQVIGEFDLLGYLTLNDTLHYGLLQLSAKIPSYLEISLKSNFRVTPDRTHSISKLKSYL